MKVHDLLLVCVAGSCLLGAAGPAAVTPLDEALAARDYDAGPFLRGIREYYSSRLGSRMGIRSLSDLPLYQMEIELDALRGTLDCHQELNFKNPWSEDLTELVFRTYPNAKHLVEKDGQNLTIESVTVNGRPASAERIHPTCWSVPLPGPLTKGERVRVGIHYTSIVPRLPPSAAGPIGTVAPGEMMQQLMGKDAQMGYGIFGTAGGVFNLGYFYPVLASRTDGAWDTSRPASMGDMAHFEVANFLVKVTAPRNMVVASSGIKVGESPLGSGNRSVKETFLLGTALRNFALQLSTRYVVKEKEFDGVRVRYIHVEAHEKGACEILDHAGSALVAFQKLFGPYPYPELDVVEAPLTGGAGGVEYPGLVTLAMSLAPGSSGNPMGDLMGMLLQQTSTTEFVLAHEVAHQWWHGLVGSDSNAHPFMDEALANYAAVLYFEARHGQAKAAEQLEVQLALPYRLMRILGGPDGQVDRPTSDFANQLQYSALVYGKGALFFHALRRMLGKKLFFTRLRTYAARHAFRQTQPKDLLASLAGAPGRAGKVRELYQRWIHGRHGDEDIGQLDPDGALQKLMGQMRTPGFHDMKIQGMDPATLKALQQAVQQALSGN